jgi:hypothetical protein
MYCNHISEAVAGLQNGSRLFHEQGARLGLQQPDQQFLQGDIGQRVFGEVMFRRECRIRRLTVSDNSRELWI